MTWTAEQYALLLGDEVAGEADSTARRLLTALAVGQAPVDAVARPAAGADLAALLDPDTAPTWLFPLIAAMAGITLDPRLSTAKQRIALKGRATTRKGAAGAIRAAAQPWITEGNAVVRERWQDDAYQVAVDYFGARLISPTGHDLDDVTTGDDLDPTVRWVDIVDDEPALRAAIRAAIPVDDVPTIRRLDGATYGDLADDFDTVGEFEAAFAAATVDDVRFYIPEKAG